MIKKISLIFPFKINQVRAVDGSIKYCFDRKFPPRERAEYCKEIAAGSE